MYEKIKAVIPLESSPEIFTNFAHELGLKRQMAFDDIYSLTEPDLMAFLPRPMKSIILLFPVNEFFDATKKKEGENDDEPIDSPDGPVIWFKQIISNACGLYALLHSLANNPDCLTEGSVLKEFLSLNKREDGKYNDEPTADFMLSISELYHKNSKQGQTEAPLPEATVDLHFITFIAHGGKIFELDGSRNSAHCLGPARGEDLLDEDLVKGRVQWYMDHADEKMKHQFSLMGMGPSWD
ncbi:ubiquitin-specific protease YUH1 Ecym_7162 [Eremothecium cymbalariae DBVPG|uniref:Ubiquitin carboxyl-terminal hydrolase n=1 Tax=Eremothecium cymbalariae (strain CBS 270.75 / DBVPG 7215 / KCTC 17166 / NRRL Y-17582) TaxID=931890 RepID=G8JVZ5_ERECY|nr:hypothetical protein Ecym_7162 [Eremothecium cymbalariae DBVPG\